VYVPRQTLQAHQSACGAVANYDAGLSVCRYPQALQAHQNACDDDADDGAGLSVCMYLGRPCRLTRMHVVMMLMMVLVCLCVCT